MKTPIICLMLALASSAGAVPITGSIGFTGHYFSDNDDLTLATSLIIGKAFTEGVTDGSFAGIPNGTVASMSSLVVNQPAPLLPIAPIWSVGGFSLVLSSIFELAGNSFDSLSLKGYGLIDDGPGGFDPTPGSWIGTFNNAGTNFTFSVSSTSVPDNGAGLMLLGLGLIAVCVFGHRVSVRAL